MWTGTPKSRESPTITHSTGFIPSEQTEFKWTGRFRRLSLGQFTTSPACRSIMDSET
ncbi:MAG: hypothetical protein JWN70_3136, partial [Planctomycetaceae bacterium]|nr:hypothetical protein [Planctomycetaceae bacterium]